MKYIEIEKPGGPEVLKIREGEIPTIGDDEVLIAVKAAGVNRPDILQREGKYPMPEGVTQIPDLRWPASSPPWVIRSRTSGRATRCAR